jgi:hypothetical protein
VTSADQLEALLRIELLQLGDNPDPAIVVDV